MKSAYKVFLAGLCSLFLVACGGGGSISDDGTGTTPQPSVVTVTLSISNSDNVSLDTPAEVQATVVDSKTGPKAGIVVTFKLDNDELGTFTPSTGTQLTDSSGVAKIKLETRNLAGAGSVTASIVTGESASIGFYSKGDGAINPGTGNKLKLFLVNAQGQAITSISTATPGVVKALYTNSSDEPLVGKVITFTSTLGKFQPESGTALTDTQGLAKIAITAGTVAGAGKIIAKADDTESEAFGFNTLGDEVVVKPIDAYSIALTITDSQGQELRNISHSVPGSVIATLRKDGVPTSYQTISFNLTGQGTLNPSSGTALTDLNGHASVTLVTGTNAGAGTVTASFSLENETITDSFNFEVAGDAPGGNGEANSLSIQLTNSQTGVPTTDISATQPGKVTVALVDKDSTPLVGKVVSFSSTLGNFLPTQGTALTDSLGRASITLTAGSIEGAGEITATYGTAKAIIGFVTAGDEIDPVEASPEISFDIYDCNDVATWDKALKNFEVCKATDNITNDKPGIVGAKVTRSGSTQALQQVLITAATTIGAISPSSGTAITNAEGKAILDLYANGNVGAGEISLKVKDVTATKAFEIGRVNISLKLETSLGGNLLPAGGSTILDVTVLNPDGSLATGQPFTLVFTSECQASNKAIIDSPVITNGGKGYATYRSTGCETQDTVSVSAITGGGSVSSTAVINIDSIKVGALQYVTASPTLLALQGTGGIAGAGARSETSVVTFKLLDETAAPAGQERVCFELSTEVGGISLSPAPLAQDYLDCPNFPKPNSPNYPADLSVPNKYAVAVTDSAGLASVIVRSGDRATPVKVFALWAGSSADGHNGVISNVSDQLAITTGLADDDSFSVSASIFNPEGWDYDNETVDINILAADHFNNMVPAGTVIVFTAEGGAIPGSCTTGGLTNPDGACGVQWRSQSPRPFSSTVVQCPVPFYGDINPPCMGPSKSLFDSGINSILTEPRPGRATITAYAIGEESFVDLNGNGLFDTNEPFTDRSEAFTDHNEDGYYRKASPSSLADLPIQPAGSVNEEFVDYNFDGIFNKADNKYTGLLCASGSSAACTDTGLDDNRAQLNIFRNIPIVMSGSTPMVRLVKIDPADKDTMTAVTEIDLIDRTDPLNPIEKEPQTVYLFVSDVNNNTLPYETKITTSIDNGKLIVPVGGSYSIASNASNKPLIYAFTIGQEDQANQKLSGALVITVKTPKGSPVSVTVNVKDGG
ncbi:Ig domain protein, group 1 domain protein [Shewanella sp. ANA-3]|uniref:invasin n=1 Tax=Shewanella sp. (strain ANA-3) TaxID=94122 RepID=UPI00005E133E|nr:invasin [Shewanella sp. ANA-3]ABK47960.1 Ig domain protein, group 1 domain protein [Shewanella sp. ANA-3]